MNDFSRTIKNAMVLGKEDLEILKMIEH